MVPCRSNWAKIPQLACCRRGITRVHENRAIPANLYILLRTRAGTRQHEAGTASTLSPVWRSYASSSIRHVVPSLNRPVLPPSFAQLRARLVRSNLHPVFFMRDERSVMTPSLSTLAHSFGRAATKARRASRADLGTCCQSSPRAFATVS